MARIILTTGGTGGHIFPALAVAEKLRDIDPCVDLLFMGSNYGPERELAGKAGIPFLGLPVRGLMGRGLKSVAALFGLGAALIESCVREYRFKPGVLAAFGGYASFAPAMAARLLGIPVLLHEQNAIAGSSNRVLAKFAQKICVSLPGTSGFAGSVIVTGNPVRGSISSAIKIRNGRNAANSKRLLVLGGSQGAHALNEYVISQLPAFRKAGLEILHQTGAKDLEVVRQAYLANGYSEECARPFIENMAEAYGWADVALCRSGASTVAELCAAGLPAVLTPFPAAIHDHQTFNAKIMQDAGAAILVPEKRLYEEESLKLLLRLFDDSEKRLSMGLNAQHLGTAHAAGNVARELMEMLPGYSSPN